MKNQWELTVDRKQPNMAMSRPVNKRFCKDIFELENALREWIGKPYPVQITIEPKFFEEVTE